MQIKAKKMSLHTQHWQEWGAIGTFIHFCQECELVQSLGSTVCHYLFKVTIHSLKESAAEKAMAPYSSTIAWKIPRTEEPGGLQSMGLQSRTQLSDFTFTDWSAVYVASGVRPVTRDDSVCFWWWTLRHHSQSSRPPSVSRCTWISCGYLLGVFEDHH